MSSETCRVAFAIMRAAARGELTPGAAEELSKVVCGSGDRYHFKPAETTDGHFTIRFTGNRIVEMLPEEKD